MNMKVYIGNASAIEGYRLPDSDDPERLHYRPMVGEFVTEFLFPEELSLSEALMAVVATMPRHTDLSAGQPAWIESDDPLLRKMLCQHYSVSEKKRKPVRWGDGSNAQNDNETEENN